MEEKRKMTNMIILTINFIYLLNTFLHIGRLVINSLQLNYTTYYLCNVFF